MRADDGRERGAAGLVTLVVVAGVLAVMLLAYLFVALLAPERF